MGISKSDEVQYRREVKEGVDVFQKSFEGAAGTKKFPEKKELFEKATHEAMEAINDAAKALANKEINKQKEKLFKDYEDYVADPNTDKYNQVEKDIQSFKDTLK